MNEWEIAAAVLGFALIPCLAVALLAAPPTGWRRWRWPRSC